MGQIKVEKNVGGIEGLCVIEPAVHGDEGTERFDGYDSIDCSRLSGKTGSSGGRKECGAHDGDGICRKHPQPLPEHLSAGRGGETERYSRDEGWGNTGKGTSI